MANANSPNARYLEVKIYNFLDIDWLAGRTEIHSLDLSEIVLPESRVTPRIETNDEFWNNFISVVRTLTKLKYIKLDSCSVSFIASLTNTNPGLKKLKAANIKGNNNIGFNTSQLRNFGNLTHLQLQFDNQHAFSFVGDPVHAPENRLQNLECLIITGVVDLPITNIIRSISFECLRSLSLGCCSVFPPQFNGYLKQLMHLKKLRLESYIGEGIITVLHTVGTMKNLEHLEITDIDVPEGIEEAIASCKNLTKFLIAPNPGSSHSVMNRRVLCGVVKLRDNLRDFCWVISRVDYTTSYYDICILNDLPLLDEYNRIIIPIRRQKGDTTTLSTNLLSAFITLFLSRCNVRIFMTSHFMSCYKIGYSF